MTTHRSLDNLKTVAFQGALLTFEGDNGLETWGRDAGTIYMLGSDDPMPLLDGYTSVEEVEDAFACYLLGRGLRLEHSLIADAFVAVEAGDGWEVDPSGCASAVIEVEGEWVYLFAHQTVFGTERFKTEAEARAYAAS